MYLEKLCNLGPGKKICLLGLGQENKQFLDWLVNVFKFKKTDILLADQKELVDFIDMGIPQQNLYSGLDYLSVLENPDLEYVFKSPGIWSKLPELEKFRVRKGSDRVQSNLVFFIEKFRSQIIAITGTKGKSTTCGLLNHLISLDGKFTSHYCGNTTNISPYTFWYEIDKKIDENIFFVVELSSFQLQDLGYSGISPKFAGITNYYIDHLNQHKTKKEYWGAKDNIFRYQIDGDILVHLEEFQNRILNINPENKKIISESEVESVREKFTLKELRGLHNYKNLSIVLGLMEVIGIKIIPEKIKKNLKTYQNLPHRLELVRDIVIPIEIRGSGKKLNINFIDDGAATEPDAVRAGVLSYTEKGDFLWLMIDGLDKGGDQGALIDVILEIQRQNQLYKVNYCGEVGENILNSIYKKMGIDIQACTEDFQKMVVENFTSLTEIGIDFSVWLEQMITNFESINDRESSSRLLKKDEYNLNILFSPCGSSFKEFSNYIQRSNWWVERVQELV